jgi:hypothetical protein
MLPLTEQPVPLAWKVTSPVPDPPDVVSEIGVPVKPVSTELETESGAWSARANTNVFDADEAPKEGEKEKGEESHCHHQQFYYHNLLKLYKKPMKSKHYLDK